MAPLNNADTYSLSSTNINPFQTNTNLNATANQCQTLYQTHIAPNIGPSATLPSPCPTVYAVNPSLVNSQIYTVPFVEMNELVKTFDGLDQQYTSGEKVNQIDALPLFTMGEQPQNVLAYNQWHKREMAHLQSSSPGITLSWFLRLHECYKNDWSASLSAV